PERLGGPEIEDQRVLDRALDRQVAGFLPLENAIYVARPLPVLGGQVDVRAVGHKTAVLGETINGGDRWQAMAFRQLRDQLRTQANEGIWRQDQSAVRLAREILQRGFDLGSVAN